MTGAERYAVNKAYHAEYRKTHKTQRAAYAKGWAAEHREEGRAAERRWYNAHRKRALAKQAEFRRRRPGLFTLYRKSARENLHDWYVKKFLPLTLAKSEVPMALIEAKRAQLLLMRVTR